VINNGNRDDKCNKERIQAGNRAYIANLSTLKSKIITRAAKIHVYKTLIRPIAKYGAEIWSLIVVEKNACRIMDQ
jgi:hypothetical protein